MKDLKSKAAKAVKWNVIARFSQYFLKFTLGVILARLLSPEEFGLIALITVITGLSNFIIDGGFSASLIQHKEVDNRDFSTVFYINIGVGLFFTLLFFFGAPLFVVFYEEPRLESIARVLSFTYLINSVTVVQKAYFIRNIDFKRISIIDVIIQTSSGVFGIILALLGFSYWALVYKSIFSASTQACLYFYFSAWRPGLFFSKSIFLKHWHFSANVLVTSFFRELSEKFDLIVIGKLFSAGDLGVFQRGKELAFIPVNFTASVINQTVFTAFSRIQDQRKRFFTNYIKIYRLVTLFVVPITALIFLNAEEFVLVLIGEQWRYVVPFLRLFAIAGALYTIGGHFNILSALGFPKFGARYSSFTALAKPTIILVLVFLIDIDMLMVAWVFISFLVFRFFYGTYHLSKKLGVAFSKIGLSNYKELLIVVLSLMAGLASSKLIHTDFLLLSLVIKTLCFCIVYAVLVVVYRKHMFTELRLFLLSSINKH